MIEIHLQPGVLAVIDDEDAHLLDRPWFLWKNPRGNLYATCHGPRRSDGERETIFLHRAVLGLKKGDPLVDHIDGDGLNCRRENLRIASRVQNGRNRRGANANNKLGICGVYERSAGRFRVHLRHQGRTVNLGTYGTVEEAIAARLAGEAQLWREDA